MDASSSFAQIARAETADSDTARSNAEAKREEEEAAVDDDAAGANAEAECWGEQEGGEDAPAEAPSAEE